MTSLLRCPLRLPIPVLLLALVGLAALGLPALPASAQPVPAGPPFGVSAGSVALNPAPVVAVGPRGEALFLWIGECPDPGLCSRGYGADGTPLGEPRLLETSTQFFDAVPAAVIGADGIATVVWSRSGEGFEREIVGKRFQLDGTPAGAEVVVASEPAQVFDRPALALAPGGGLLVAFEKLRFDGYLDEAQEIPVYTGVEILARRLAPSGTPLGDTFRVDGPSADVVGAPAVAVAGTGDGVEYLVAWESFDFLTGLDDVLYRPFEPAGDGTATPLGDETAVAPPAPEIRRAPTAAGTPQGTFLVVWEVGLTGVRLRAQVVAPGGPVFPFPFEVGQGAGLGTTTGENLAPRAAGGDGVFAVAWENTVGAVFVRRYDEQGVPLEERLRADAPAEGLPRTPDVGVFGGPGADSGLVVGWTREEPDFDRLVLGRRYAGTVPPPEPCVEDELTLCLGADGRFEVRTTWATQQGTSGDGRADELTGDTGYFWFFRESNLEVIVKVLDGCPVNGRFWVFAAGLTNVQVALTVRDSRTDEVRLYPNALGQAFQPIQDTAAFPCP